MGETGPLGNCADFFASLDNMTKEAEALDPGVFRVHNYPYLRVNRFIASFRDKVDDKAAFAAWTDRMQTLDQDARKYEIANLPNSGVAALNSVNDRAGLYSKVATCGDLLKTADFQKVKHQVELSKSVSVPNEYITLRRVLGIYPFTSMFVYCGVSKWHAEAQKSFSPEPPANASPVGHRTGHEKRPAQPQDRPAESCSPAVARRQAPAGEPSSGGRTARPSHRKAPLRPPSAARPGRTGTTLSPETMPGNPPERRPATTTARPTRRGV